MIKSQAKVRLSTTRSRYSYLDANIDYLIVDVRDEDWKEGNIKGARNYPSQRFSLEVDDLIKDTKDVPIMIFHCKLSQERYGSSS